MGLVQADQGFGIPNISHDRSTQREPALFENRKMEKSPAAPQTTPGAEHAVNLDGGINDFPGDLIFVHAAGDVGLTQR